jgi:hypothetical protein
MEEYKDDCEDCFCEIEAWHALAEAEKKFEIATHLILKELTRMAQNSELGK